MREGMGRGDAGRDVAGGARQPQSHPAQEAQANFPGVLLRPWATPGSAPHPCLSPPIPQPVKVMQVLPRFSFHFIFSLSLPHRHLRPFHPPPPAAASGRSPPGARRWRRALREMAVGAGTD